MKLIKLGKYKVRVIDKNYDFITTYSWLNHLESLSAIQLFDGINDLKLYLSKTRKTMDHDLVYENHLLTTFSWKLTYKQQLTIFDNP